MTPKPPKPKTCRHCKALFIPTRPPGQVACSFDCAMAISRAKGAKAAAVILKGQRKALAEGRERLKSAKTKLTEALGRAQAQVNKWIRWRDRATGCLICGKTSPGSYVAGHYLSRKGYPEIRFLEDNIWKICYSCNVPNSGGVAPAYRRNLIAHIGRIRVEAVEALHPAAHYTIEDAKRIEAEYKAKLKALADYNL